MIYVSLGSTCCIAQQLKNHNLRNAAYPFDWLRICNLNNVIKLLENKFKDFLELEDMKFIEFSDRFLVDGNSGSYIYKNKYCGFYHDFSEKIYESNYNSFRDKYNRRINRLFQLLNSNNEIIFIREELREIKISKFYKLIDTIKKINPKLNFKIIVITNDKKCENLDVNHVSFFYINENITHWSRPEINWDNLFKSK